MVEYGVISQKKSRKTVIFDYLLINFVKDNLKRVLKCIEVKNWTPAPSAKDVTAIIN
jgi:hypothetical protein